MVKLLKKRVAAFITLLLVISMFSVPALANSAQVHWRGTTSSGVIIIGDDCPIEMESERLVFEVKELPQQYYSDAEEFLHSLSLIHISYRMVIDEEAAHRLLSIYTLGGE